MIVLVLFRYFVVVFFSHKLLQILAQHLSVFRISDLIWN